MEKKSTKPKFARIKEAHKNIRKTTSIALWSFSIVAVSLQVASFIIPPMGVIDPSVLRAGSLIFTFAALFEFREAVVEGFGVSLTHGDTSVTVHDMDGNPEEKSIPETTHNYHKESEELEA